MTKGSGPQLAVRKEERKERNDTHALGLIHHVAEHHLRRIDVQELEVLLDETSIVLAGEKLSGSVRGSSDREKREELKSVDVELGENFEDLGSSLGAMKGWISGSTRERKDVGEGDSPDRNPIYSFQSRASRELVEHPRHREIGRWFRRRSFSRRVLWEGSER